HAGGAPMSPEIARKVIGLFRRVRPPAEKHSLTPQEIKLLALLADGYSYQNAASQLDISINTVRNHVRSIYEKLHVHTKSEAVSKGLKAGILRKGQGPAWGRKNRDSYLGGLPAGYPTFICIPRTSVVTSAPVPGSRARPCAPAVTCVQPVGAYEP